VGKGYSARTLAYCWHAANSIPAEVLSVLELSGMKNFWNYNLG
jgi:hypothetical protein